MPNAPQPKKKQPKNKAKKPSIPVWRDVRQIIEVDAFFRGARPDGPMASAPWMWPTLIGRTGALAFMLGCKATREDAHFRSNVEALAAAWPDTIFAREPERFRVIETVLRDLPFP